MTQSRFRLDSESQWGRWAKQCSKLGVAAVSITTLNEKKGTYLGRSRDCRSLHSLLGSSRRTVQSSSHRLTIHHRMSSPEVHPQTPCNSHRILPVVTVNIGDFLTMGYETCPDRKAESRYVSFRWKGVFVCFTAVAGVGSEAAAFCLCVVAQRWIPDKKLVQRHAEYCCRQITLMTEGGTLNRRLCHVFAVKVGDAFIAGIGSERRFRESRGP